ncbi:60S ribosomal protein L27a [Colletotrichum spaethianum]|uniref:Large ribosomal subunit protein uL15 n=1 Tax=Colletotrichum spaethianum TaxID=700344 RepID=A0AA37UKR2_9PEZI|nr:60S ribosomal protein L27a [Colletotrichum spaethianum]GKT50461.1 60S ribosomal protein L27a [Colletotrichum spaethianum]
MTVSLERGRGHVSAGHGRVGKHRKHPGGRGLAGGQHHHRTNLDKYHPGYFGKVGMRYFHKQQKYVLPESDWCQAPGPLRGSLRPRPVLTIGSHFWKPVINLDKLWTLVPAEKREEYLANKGDKVPVIDLLPFGYSKLLGKGRLPEVPIVVKARWVSKLAEKKITEAGGVVELVA